MAYVIQRGNQFTPCIDVNDVKDKLESWFDVNAPINADNPNLTYGEAINVLIKCLREKSYVGRVAGLLGIRIS